MKDQVTFSFGQNWKEYVETVAEDAERAAASDIESWIGRDWLAGKTVLDIGCGSGIHSLCFHRLGAREVISVDVDPKSVEATRVLWDRAGRPPDWRVLERDVLDRDSMLSIGARDVVYSWGVLHHTGAMWQAIDNASAMVREGGLLWIALYVKGPHYAADLALKKAYNRATPFGKKLMVGKWIARLMARRVLTLRNPFGWNQKKERGMDTYHDLIDWLGGLPYEVASKSEVVDFCADRALVLRKIEEQPEGGNNIFLFSRRVTSTPT